MEDLISPELNAKFDAFREKLSNSPLKCNFCGATKEHVDHLVEGYTAFASYTPCICDVCIGICIEVIEKNGAAVRVKNFAQKLRESE